MDDHVIHDIHRCLNESPVEIYVVLDRAGTPAIAIINDLGIGECHSEIIGKLFGPGQDFFPGLVHVPISQDLLALSRKPRRDQETLLETNLFRAVLDYFDLILTAQVECGFAVDQLFARRMR